MNKVVYILLILIIACTSKNTQKRIEVESKPYPNKEWLYANLEYSAPTQKSLDSLNNLFAEKFSLLIIKGGKTIFENYQAPYLEDSLIHINSCTKGVISMLFGMVFRNDLRTHENKPSISYFPEYNISDSAIYKIKNKHIFYP